MMSCINRMKRTLPSNQNQNASSQQRQVLQRLEAENEAENEADREVAGIVEAAEVQQLAKQPADQAARKASARISLKKKFKRLPPQGVRASTRIKSKTSKNSTTSNNSTAIKVDYIIDKVIQINNDEAACQEAQAILDAAKVNEQNDELPNVERYYKIFLNQTFYFTIIDEKITVVTDLISNNNIDCEKFKKVTHKGIGKDVIWGQPVNMIYFSVNYVFDPKNNRFLERSNLRNVENFIWRSDPEMTTKYPDLGRSGPAQSFSEKKIKDNIEQFIQKTHASQKALEVARGERRIELQIEKDREASIPKFLTDYDSEKVKNISKNVVDAAIKKAESVCISSRGSSLTSMITALSRGKSQEQETPITFNNVTMSIPLLFAAYDLWHDTHYGFRAEENYSKQAMLFSQCMAYDSLYKVANHAYKRLNKQNPELPQLFSPTLQNEFSEFPDAKNIEISFTKKMEMEHIVPYDPIRISYQSILQQTEQEIIDQIQNNNTVELFDDQTTSLDFITLTFQEREKIARVILYALYGEIDDSCEHLFTFDANVGTLRKILNGYNANNPNQSPVKNIIKSVITPQNIADSANTTRDENFGSGIVHVFPTTHTNTHSSSSSSSSSNTVDLFVSKNNYFSYDLYDMVYSNTKENDERQSGRGRQMFGIAEYNDFTFHIAKRAYYADSTICPDLYVSSTVFNSKIHRLTSADRALEEWCIVEWNHMEKKDRDKILQKMIEKKEPDRYNKYQSIMKARAKKAASSETVSTGGNQHGGAGPSIKDIQKTFGVTSYISKLSFSKFSRSANIGLDIGKAPYLAHDIVEKSNEYHIPYLEELKSMGDRDMIQSIQEIQSNLPPSLRKKIKTAFVTLDTLASLFARIKQVPCIFELKNDNKISIYRYNQDIFDKQKIQDKTASSSSSSAAASVMNDVENDVPNDRNDEDNNDEENNDEENDLFNITNNASSSSSSAAASSASASSAAASGINDFENEMPIVEPSSSKQAASSSSASANEMPIVEPPSSSSSSSSSASASAAASAASSPENESNAHIYRDISRMDYIVLVYFINTMDYYLEYISDLIIRLEELKSTLYDQLSNDDQHGIVYAFNIYRIDDMIMTLEYIQLRHDQIYQKYWDSCLDQLYDYFSRRSISTDTVQAFIEGSAPNVKMQIAEMIYHLSTSLHDYMSDDRILQFYTSIQAYKQNHHIDLDEINFLNYNHFLYRMLYIQLTTSLQAVFASYRTSVYDKHLSSTLSSINEYIAYIVESFATDLGPNRIYMIEKGEPPEVIRRIDSIYQIIKSYLLDHSSHQNERSYGGASPLKIVSSFIENTLNNPKKDKNAIPFFSAATKLFSNKSKEIAKPIMINSESSIIPFYKQVQPYHEFEFLDLLHEIPSVICTLYVEEDPFSAIHVMMRILSENRNQPVSFCIEQHKLYNYLVALLDRVKNETHNTAIQELITLHASLYTLSESPEKMNEEIYRAIDISCMKIINQIRTAHLMPALSIFNNNMKESQEDSLFDIWINWNNRNHADDDTSKLLREILDPMYPHKQAAFLTLSLISHQLQGKVARGTSMISTVLNNTSGIQNQIVPFDPLPFDEQWKNLHGYITKYLNLFKPLFLDGVPPVAPVEQVELVPAQMEVAANMKSAIKQVEPAQGPEVMKPATIVEQVQSVAPVKPVSMADGGKRKPKRRTLKKSRSYRALVTKINKLKHARTRIRNRR